MSDVYDELRIPLIARIAGVVQIMASLTVVSVGLQAATIGGWLGLLAAIAAVLGGLVGFVLGGWLTQGRGLAAIMTVVLDLAALAGLLGWFLLALLYLGVFSLLPLLALFFLGFATLLVAIATPGGLRLDAARREVMK